MLQLEPLMNRKPGTLSGGQRQRVAIGRAWCEINPKVFLFDEPLSNLDAALRGQMRLELASLQNSLQATMIYVTHDQTEAMTLATKIVVLQGGVVEQIGAPMELYHHPCNKFVAGFIGSPKMNFLPVTTSSVQASGITLKLPGGAEVKVPVQPGALRMGDRTTLGIRPEHMRIDSSHPVLVGEVLVVERLGDVTSGNEFDSQNPNIQHDLQHPNEPTSVYGFLAAALRRRRLEGIPPFTVLSCDNVQGNGNL